MQRYVCFVLAALFLSSCSNGNGPHIIPKQQFTDLYVRLTAAGISVRAAGADTALAKARADSILHAFGCTRAEVLATVDRLNADPESWKPILNEAVKRIERRK